MDFSSVVGLCLKVVFVMALIALFLATIDGNPTNGTFSTAILFLGFRLSDRDRRAIKTAAQAAATTVGVDAAEREASLARRGRSLRDDIMMAVDPEGEAAALFPPKNEAEK